jgi:hypothetical protein
VSEPQPARKGKTIAVWLPWSVVEALSQQGRPAAVAAEIIASSLGLPLGRQRREWGSKPPRRSKDAT